MLFYFISAPMISYLKIWCDFRIIIFYLFTKYKEEKEKKKQRNKTNDVEESLITLLPIPLEKSSQNKFNNIKQYHNQ